MTASFADVARTARGHLGLLFYEAAARLVAHLRERATAAGVGDDAVLREFPFLAHYHRVAAERVGCDPATAAGLARFRRAVEAWERDTPAWLPLRALREVLGLGADAVVALVAAGLVEEDAQFAALFAALRAPPGTAGAAAGASAIPVSLLRDLVTVADETEDAWDVVRPLVDAALLDVADPSAPRAAWALRVPAAVWSAVRGEPAAEPFPGVRYRTSEELLAGGEPLLAPEESRRVAELAALLAAGEARAVVVRGSEGTERLEVVGTLARALGCGLLVIDRESQEGDPSRDASHATPRHLGAVATLRRALPVFVARLAPGETLDVPPLAGCRAPVAAVLGLDGGAGGELAGALTLTLGPQPAPVRRQQWARAFAASGAGPRVEPADLDLLAETFAFGGRYVRQAARLAAAHAALDGRARITLADARAAARAVNRQQLDALAARLDDAGGWGQLVVPAATAAELAQLEHRCRHRERLAATLGATLPGGMNRGVRAIFDGPSGTGKTLAARALASELGLDVYRVDLASVINKYIGETEKNLSRVLGRAEDLDVVLLLDEGDALLGRRTDVKTSNDRYANLETNYLLQRLESYGGIVIVTTNAGKAVDSAFHRRMDAIVKFSAPDAEQRWLLWQLHLPADHDVAPEALEAVAVRHALTGGQIRVAAIGAALGALAAGGRVTERELEQAIDGEYRKAGASPPRAAVQLRAPGTASVAAFLCAVT